MADYGIGFYNESGELITNFDFGDLVSGAFSSEVQLYLIYKKGEPDGSIAKNVLLKVVNKDGLEEGPFVENGLVYIKVGDDTGYFLLSRNNYYVIEKMEADVSVPILIKLKIPLTFVEGDTIQKFKIIAIPEKTAFPITSAEKILISDGIIISLNDSVNRNLQYLRNKGYRHKTFHLASLNKETYKTKDSLLTQEKSGGLTIRRIQDGVSSLEVYKTIPRGLLQMNDRIKLFGDVEGSDDTWEFALRDSEGREATEEFYHSYPDSPIFDTLIASMDMDTGFDPTTVEKIFFRCKTTPSDTTRLTVTSILVCRENWIRFGLVWYAKKGKIKIAKDETFYKIDYSDYSNSSFYVYVTLNKDTGEIEKEALLEGQTFSLGENKILLGILYFYYSSSGYYIFTPVLWHHRFGDGKIEIDDSKIKVATWMYKTGEEILYNTNEREFGPFVSNQNYKIWIDNINGEMFVSYLEENGEGLIKYATFETDEKAMPMNLKYNRNISSFGLIEYPIFRIGISPLGGLGKIRKDNLYMRIGAPIGRRILKSVKEVW